MARLKTAGLWMPHELEGAPYLLGMSLMICFDALTPFLCESLFPLGLDPMQIAECTRTACYLLAAIAATFARKLFCSVNFQKTVCLMGCLGVILVEAAPYLPSSTATMGLSMVGLLSVGVFWCAGMLKFFELFSSVSLGTTIATFTLCHLAGSLLAITIVLASSRITAVIVLGLIPIALLILGSLFREPFTAAVEQNAEEGSQRPSIPIRPLALMLVTLFVAGLVRSRIPAQLVPASYSGALACAFVLVVAMQLKRRAVHPRTLYNATLFLLMSGLLLFTIQGSSFVIASGALVNGGYLAFDVFITGLLCNICCRYKINPYWIFGLLCFVTCLSYDAGNMFGEILGSQSESVTAFVAFASAVVVAIAFVTLLTERDYRTSWGALKDETRQLSVAMYYHSLSEACASVSEEYGLTRREEDVLLLLSQRKTIPDIEGELFISNSTAKTHCKNIYRKLGIHKREELLALMGHPSVSNNAPEP